MSRLRSSSATDYLRVAPCPRRRCASSASPFPAVSVFGSFGAEAQGLLRRLSRRRGRSVPPSLSGESSWATPTFAPFARMSISLACRRALAFSVRSSVVADPASVEPQAIPADPERSFQCACHVDESDSDGPAVMDPGQ